MPDKQQERQDRRVANASGEAGGAHEGGRESEGTAPDTDRHQSSALGGDVATRSGTAPTPDDEKAS